MVTGNTMTVVRTNQNNSNLVTIPTQSNLIRPSLGFDPRRRQIDFCWKKGSMRSCHLPFYSFRERGTNWLIKTGQHLIQWSESFTLVWKVLLQTPPQNAQDTCHHFGNCIHGIEGHSRCQSEVQTWPASSKFFFIFAFQNSCIFNEANQVISCVRADNQWTKSCRKTCEKDLDTRSTNLCKVEIAKLWMKTASNICLYVN